MNYTPYPTVKTVPSRKTRKGQRSKIYATNAALNSRRVRKAAKEAANQ